MPGKTSLRQPTGSPLIGGRSRRERDPRAVIGAALLVAGAWLAWRLYLAGPGGFGAARIVGYAVGALAGAALGRAVGKSWGARNTVCPASVGAVLAAELFGIVAAALS